MCTEFMLKTVLWAVTLVWISAVDIQRGVVPQLGLQMLQGIFAATCLYTPLALEDIVSAALCFLGVGYVLRFAQNTTYRVSHVSYIGEGDIQLLQTMALTIPWHMWPCVGYVSGGLAFLVHALQEQSCGARIPFAPCLCVAWGVVSLCCEDPLSAAVYMLFEA